MHMVLESWKHAWINFQMAGTMRCSTKMDECGYCMLLGRCHDTASLLHVSHVVEQVEFVEGLLNLCLLDMPIATIQTLKLLQLIRASINQLLSATQTSPTQAFTQVQPRRELTNLSKCSIRQI